MLFWFFFSPFLKEVFSCNNLKIASSRSSLEDSQKQATCTCLINESHMYGPSECLNGLPHTWHIHRPKTYSDLSNPINVANCNQTLNGRAISQLNERASRSQLVLELNSNSLKLVLRSNEFEHIWSKSTRTQILLNYLILTARSIVQK